MITFLWFSNNKLLTCVSILLACFVVSTVVLGVKNRKAIEELAKCQDFNGDEEINEVISTTTELAKPIFDYRLPEDVLPLRYDLYLYPDLNTGLFFGTVDIRMSILADRKSVVLHTKYLNVTSTILRTSLGTEVAIATAEEDFDLEQWIVSLENSVPVGNYTLSLRFHGNLTSTDIVGFYMSSYTAEDNGTSFHLHQNPGMLRATNSVRGFLKILNALCLPSTSDPKILDIPNLRTFFHDAGESEKSMYADSSESETSSVMSGESPSDLSFRLPKEIKPLHYDLYLYPDLVITGNFQGKVTILIDILDKRSYISLHQKDLRIISTKLKTFDREENSEIDIKETYTIEKLETFVIVPKKDINSGLYNLSLEFSGSLRLNNIVGFYSSTYKDSEKKTRYIATSKLEPTYARRSFPCFDEPGFKAEFSIKLVHPNGDGYGALSNMNVESSSIDEPSPGLTTVTFAKSVPMSTYLACFIVSDFVAVTATARGLNGKTFPVSVYTTQVQKKKGAFALDIGVKVIEYYINLFGIDYPLPKLDMAAIPDFVSGAMENWGLVTYREAGLLYDKDTSSTANKERTVIVISHEFAHMWFGNLVTIAWWNDLWLNEGFATYMQYKSADAIFPDWGMVGVYWTYYEFTQMHSVFVTDATLNSHPIVQTVSNPDEITAIFDVISYDKGASIIRMLDNFVGSDVFYAGITTYLNKYAYRNAETADLFAILQAAVGNRLNVTAIMDTWTRQMGFPVVNVDKNGNTYTLTQKRFLADPEAEFDPAESDYGYKWTIPITYITNKNLTPTLLWFDKDAPNLVIDLQESVDWIKFNKDQIGYYRTNYNSAEWKTLGNVLRTNHTTFSTSDRAHLLEDAFSLAEATELEFDVAMDITTYLIKETRYVPWSVAATKLTSIHNLLSSTTVITNFKAYVKELVNASTIEDSESHDGSSVRVTISELGCLVGHAQFLQEMGQMFTSWINDTNDVRPHPDIASIVYYYGMNSVGGETEWNIMFQRFVDETDPTEKLRLMRGLAGARSTSILKKYIALAIDEAYIRSQDYFTCIRLIADNPVGTSLVWDWVRENWEILVNRYSLNNRYLGQMIPGITRTFSTELKLEEMKIFFNKYPEAGAGIAYRAQALERVSNNIKWLKKNSGKLERWLENHLGSNN